MDLFGSTRVASLDGMHYAYVLVEDYSRFTWVCFLAHKNDAFKAFENFAKRVQKEKEFCISSIRSDHGIEFENEFFKTFCNENVISHTFSSPRTPQQNGSLKEKIELLWKWLEQCFMSIAYLYTFGRKPLTLHVIF